MTLLDYFAGQALAATQWSMLQGEHAKVEQLASACYHVAQAMLTERKKVLDTLADEYV